MSATRCVTTQHLSSLQYVPELTHSKQIGNRKQTYWKNKVHRVKQTVNFLSTPFVNNAMFQRIKWISLNKRIRNTYQCRRLSTPEKSHFLYWTQRITAWLSTRFALKFVISLLNYLGYWFLSVLYSPILKCFYSIAIGYRLIRLIICDYLLSTLKLWDQNLNPHLLPPFISYRSSGEKLIKYQANLCCMITSVILMTILFYKALILQGEIWCWSLLGLKGLILGMRKGREIYH